jgi:two-component system, LytTR family, response regulator
MDLLLIEDEPLALARLEEGVREYDPAVRIVATLGSVAESIDWLRRHRHPDLVLMDVQLSDGLSLEVLRAVPLACPVVMVTAYDEYVLEALAHSCIDYLLKPVRQERLAQALDKYVRLRSHFAGDLPRLLRTLVGPGPRPSDRILVRKGLDFVSIPMEDVAFFFAEHKLVFLCDRRGTRYLVDRPLADLEKNLDPARFFRLNRRYLAHVEAILRFRPGKKGRIEVTLAPAPREPVAVSQERALAFRAWIGGRPNT